MQIAIVVDDNATGVFRAAVGSLIQTLLPKGEFSIISVAGRVSTVVEFTNAPDKLRDAIGQLIQRTGAQNGTFVIDGILEAGKTLEKRHAVRPVIVALTVGSATDRSATGPGEALRRLKQSMATLYVISIANSMVSGAVSGGNVGDLMDATVNVNQVLDEGPKQSGGRRLPLTAIPDIAPAISKVADQLQHQYAITYTLPDGVKPNERLQVSVKKPGVTVLAPTKIGESPTPR